MIDQISQEKTPDVNHEYNGTSLPFSCRPRIRDIGHLESFLFFHSQQEPQSQIVGIPVKQTMNMFSFRFSLAVGRKL